MARVSLRAACDQARQWLESNDLERAIGLCDHILQESPGNLEAYRILGETCLANRQLDRAQEAFERVLRSDPESIPAHVGLGITFERRGKLDRAVQEFEQALEIKPDMPELRSQLLRLYSDGGIENAQLRLSRAGLARLYAKGQMLPQAIAELRHVIAEQPNRYDAKVALAETLWRDEQEAESASLCRKLVGERSELLKAQLLLGYIDLSAGRPSGEQYWRAAAVIDPDLTLARALFDPLPPIVIEPPTINAWDEQAWQRQRDELEQIAATRPMQAVDTVSLPVEPQEFVPGASFFANRPAVASFDPSGSDDFLAGLLDLDTKSTAQAKPVTPETVATPPVVGQPPEDLGLDADMEPFSLSELGLSDDELAGLNPIVPPPAPAVITPPTRIATPDVLPVDSAIPPVVYPAPSPVTPSSDRSDLSNLMDENDDDLVAFSLNSLDDASVPPAVPTASLDVDDDLSDINAFSLGLLDDTPPAPPTPSLPTPVVLPNTPKPAPEPDMDDLGLENMQPFSFADLGLSEEEIAGLESLDLGTDKAQQASAAQPTAPVDDYSDLPLDLLPFSMDALDQSSGRSNDLGSLPSSLQPFSIDDAPGTQRPRVSGLTPDLGSEPITDDEEESSRSQRGFSWQQPSTKPEANFAQSIRQPEPPAEATLFNKLKQRRENTPVQPAEELPDVTLQADEHLGLFSIDDVPLTDQSIAGESSLPQITGIARREGTSVFSQPVPPTPIPTPSAPKLQPSTPVIPAVVVPPVVPPTPAIPATSSLADSEYMRGTIAADDLQPFSLEDLGLSTEEIAALGLGEAVAPASATVPEPEPTVIAPTSPVVHEHVEVNTDLDMQSALATGEIQPFSFADLGLSEEEIAALGLSEAPTSPSEPLNLAALGLSEDILPGEPTIQPPRTAPEEKPAFIEPAATLSPEHVEVNTDLDVQSALATGEIQPFSFADLGLSEEEIAALGLGEAVAPAPATVPEPEPTVIAPTPPVAHEHVEVNTDLDVQSALATGEIQPFSFADLGLSEEEIAALGLSEEAPSASAPAPTIEAFTLDEPETSVDDISEPQPFSLDLNLDVDTQPISLPSSGRKPETEMPSLDDDLQPFSLGEFGFADDESGLSTLDLPDSLSHEDPNLSLTAEELAGLDVGGDLNLKESAAPRATSPQPDAINTGDRAADRLITLGRRQGYVDISDIIAAVENPEEEADRIEAIGRLLHQQEIEIRDGDEIIDMDAEYAEEDEYGSDIEDVMSGVGAGETGSFRAFDIAPVSPAAEPDMIPFSLNELGLSDEEIALLGLGEVDSTPAPSPTPAAQPEELDLVSFPLSDLGLDDAPTAPSDDIDVLPFSFGDATVGDSSVEAAHPEIPIVSPPVIPPVSPTPAVPVTPAVPPTPVVPTPTVVSSTLSTGNEMLDQYLHRVESDPENHPLRLSVARASARFEQTDLAIRQYKQLIRRGALLDDVVDDLTDLIAESDDQTLLRNLHRTLGDAYSKQGHLDRAMEIYSWTPDMPKAIR